MRRKKKKNMMMMMVNWSHRNSSKGFKGRIGSHGRKTFKIFTKKEDSHIRNITHNTGCVSVRN
jgi:hypothetical protein